MLNHSVTKTTWVQTVVKLIRVDKKALKVNAKQHREALMKDPISKKLLEDEEEQVKREEKKRKEEKEERAT